MEGLIFGGAYLRRENLHFQIDRASLIVGSKLSSFMVFALFYFAFEGNFPSTSSWELTLILEGRFNGEFFFLHYIHVHVFGEAYTWRGLFLEFYSTLPL